MTNKDKQLNPAHDTNVVSKETQAESKDITAQTIAEWLLRYADDAARRHRRYNVWVSDITRMIEEYAAEKVREVCKARAERYRRKLVNENPSDDVRRELLFAIEALQGVGGFDADDFEPTQWQPIETAPRDGTCILAWYEGVSVRPMVIRFMDGSWIGATFESGRNTVVDATHWMPLPEPPKEGE